ncbi:hypothetical protein [Mucilaginibacter gotjawali]|nr:hypothetical protein [Mucilaginibacter gotjawali]MBB3055954.1 hypothetical protein [Mucilaginibacter gotjawali]
MTGFILAPQKNDVYELNLKDDVYTLYKIKKIVSDTIYFWPSKFQTDQASGLSDIADKGDKGFDESITVGFPKVKLLEMHKTGAIIAVDRK